jgi:two-component system phosphate regulon response regulator PhoB
MNTLLIVEDEAAIRDMVGFALPSAEFKLLAAENVAQAMRFIADEIPDLILLDWMLPGKSGIEFAKELKRSQLTCDIPIIMLTAKAEEEHKIKGLEAADDYVTKPFSPRELIARIRSVLRRGPLITPQGLLQVEQLCLNVTTHQVTVNQSIVKLTPQEYQLLHFFLTHQDRIYSREHLIHHLWGGNSEVSDRTVDVQVKRLRQALAPFGYDQIIKTVRSEGYCFSKGA